MPRKKVYDQNDPNVILARLALEEKAEKLAEKKRQEESRDQALQQMYATEKETSRKMASFQRVCDHLLGNHRLGVIPDRRHCALRYDQFSNKMVRIYCGKCRFEWRPGDAADHIMRRQGDELKKLPKVSLPNPTGKSWDDIRKFFFTFPNHNDLMTRAFRIDRIETEELADGEERQAVQVA